MSVASQDTNPGITVRSHESSFRADGTVSIGSKHDVASLKLESSGASGEKRPQPPAKKKEGGRLALTRGHTALIIYTLPLLVLS